jgi:transcriptional regulator with XRE-family HTH domain
MSIASKEFGRRLTGERERRGILLETIAESTKIKASLLADLERGDVSKWPRGIFRRAFVREYAMAIGLAADDVAAEFFELFPEEGAIVRRQADRGGSLRLTLADTSSEDRTTAAFQVLVAVGELVVLGSVAWTTAWLTPVDVPTACAALGLTYYPLASACWGRSPALRWFHRRRDGVLTSPPASASDFLRRLVSQPEAPSPDADASRLPGSAPSENLQVASR